MKKLNHFVVCVFVLCIGGSDGVVTGARVREYSYRDEIPDNYPGLPSFDSTDIYQTLHFGANWTKFKLFWKSMDFNFEGRYFKKQTCFSSSSCALPHLQVYVVPFSHNDPGWLKTFENYFDTKTRFILDNAVEKLNQYEDMRFVWSEISFLSKWWNTVANSTQKRIMKKLLNEGRLEILTGGWVMADEASPSIFGLTQQLIEGHSWLKRNMNYKPKSAWSIDPFGHGSVMPYLLESSGIQGMMIQRLHYAWKHWLAEHRYGDFLWNQRWDDKGEHKIHCLNAPYDLYPTKHSCGPTPEECMRFNFRDIPGHKNEEHLSFMKPVSSHNIVELADRLMGQYRRTASLTRHNIVITGLGNDFEFDNALEWDQQYQNYQKLFNFINTNPDRYNAQVEFGTLSQYFEAVKATKVQLPNFQGDFFPYSDVYFPYPPAYWTGYYGTRPFWKKLSRETEDELRKAEILFTFTLNLLRQHNAPEAEVLAQQFNYLVQARRWVSLFMHHDGITGTSPRPTMIDYAKKLFDAIRFSEYIQSACAKLLIQRQDPSKLNEIGDTFANLADQVPLKLKDQEYDIVKKVVLFNSLGWKKSHLVRILVDTTNVKVFDASGEQIIVQINPKIGVTDKGEPGIFSGYYEIAFIADLAPLALTTYQIRKGRETENPIDVNDNFIVPASVQCKNCPYRVDKLQAPYISLGNDQIEVTVDTYNGLITRISRKLDQLTSAVKISVGKYEASYGSGAYLSRPRTDKPIDLMADCKYDNGTQLYTVSGPVLQEVTMICKEMMISTYVLQDGYPEALSAVYLSNSVKPTSTGLNHGEFFMRFQTDLDTIQQNTYNDFEEPVFYTDNGLGVEKRMKVSRLNYEGNLYPVVNYAFIQDTYSKRRFTVLIDRAHGFTSTGSGHLETIFDRRLPYDDARGMDEGVNDPEDMVSNYVLLLEPLPSTVSYGTDKSWLPTLATQRASKFLNHQPSIFVYDDKGNEISPPISLFSKQFPADVFLLNFRTAPGSSRGVPGRKALMIFQNMGHSLSGNGSRVFGSDLNVHHFAEQSDLTGDTISGTDHIDDLEKQKLPLNTLKYHVMLPNLKLIAKQGFTTEFTEPILWGENENT